jgi:hypothetical protein
MKFLTLRQRSLKGGWMTSPLLFPILTRRNLKNGMTKRMATGFHPLCPTPNAPKLLGAVNGKRTCHAIRYIYLSLIFHWSSPYKANPKYKGKWYAPMIDNPAYKGPWSPRKIPNPNYFEDNEPVKSLNKIVRSFFVS